MKFITHKISTASTPGSFEAFVKKATSSKEQVKTASEETEVKTALADNDDDSTEKGKFPEEFKPEQEAEDDDEPCCAEGEQEVKVAEGCDQDDQECVEKGKFPDEFTGGDDHPDNGKDGTCCAEGETETKEAEVEDEDENKVEASNDESDDSETKEAGNLPEALEKHKFKAKDDSGDGEATEAEASDDDSETKEASVTKEAGCPCCNGGACTCDQGCTGCDCGEKTGCYSSNKDVYTKVANMTKEEKAWLEEYWRKQYPQEYVDAMLQNR